MYFSFAIQWQHCWLSGTGTLYLHQHQIRPRLTYCSLGARLIAFRIRISHSVTIHIQNQRNESV